MKFKEDHEATFSPTQIPEDYSHGNKKKKKEKMAAEVAQTSDVTPEVNKSDARIPVIEIGEDDSSDAGSLSSTDSDLTSISSSVYDYVYENGRRYPSQRSRLGESMLPNDEAEQDRLDLSHHYLLLMMKGHLYQSPLAQIKPKRALDLGTGTGLSSSLCLAPTP
jgi:hypothetical protein